jgi:hypothetical protein
LSAGLAKLSTATFVVFYLLSLKETPAMIREYINFPPGRAPGSVLIPGRPSALVGKIAVRKIGFRPAIWESIPGHDRPQRTRCVRIDRSKHCGKTILSMQ